MSASGHGNVSVRLPDHPDLIVLNTGDLLVPPASNDRRVTTAADGLVGDAVAIVDLEGTVVAGTVRPLVHTVIRMHTEVYRLRPEVNSVLHTHSPNATAFAIAGKPLPARYEALFVHGQLVDVPVSPWGPRGSDLAVRGIADTLEQNPETNALLLANHGLLVAASNAAHTATLVVAIEEAARATLGALLLGSPPPRWPPPLPFPT